MKSTLSGLLLALSLILGINAEATPASPVLRFSQVSGNVFRSARPTPDGLRWLAANGFKVIINLENDRVAVEAERKLATELGMRFVSIPLSGFYAPSNANVNRALATIDSAQGQFVLVHCKRGQDRTGVVIGLYRIEKQNWPAIDAYNEMMNIGFHPSLLGLNLYFATRSGLYTPDLALF